MKIKIKVRHKGKTLYGTKEIPNKAHLAAQISFPAIVYKDKTRYTRKAKHKKKEYSED